jgi:molecular chaperone DnaJ
VTIPRGLRDGRNLILGGVGNEIKNGRNGDVICVITVLEHEEYKIDGLNLTKKLDTPFIDMILGKESEFDTLDGRVKITIPKNCQTDKTFRLRHKGMYDESGIRGDLLVTIKPTLPKEVNEEEIKQLEELKTHDNFI